MLQTEIETMIREAFPDARIEVKDLAGDGNHYAATVVSPAFKGKTRPSEGAQPQFYRRPLAISVGYDPV
jgi:stress-induced morphogen